MPALEALVDSFEGEAHTQAVGISVDSRHSHANWAWDLGGVSFPLLSDFQPRGAVAAQLGVYLEGAGFTDRATVIVDRAGVVRFAESVGPGGRRDIQQLLHRARALAHEVIDRDRVGRAVAGVRDVAGQRGGIARRVVDDAALRPVAVGDERLGQREQLDGEPELRRLQGIRRAREPGADDKAVGVESAHELFEHGRQ